MRMRRLVLIGVIFSVSTTAHAQQRPVHTFGRALAPAPAVAVLERNARGRTFYRADCETDKVRGREAANSQHSSSGWMAGGVASGVVLGLIGAGIITAIASSSAPQVQQSPDGVDAACYRDGFTSRARSRNTTSALAGGLIGTAAFLLIYLSATSDY
jgi:hypothetical protein